jgi:murein DD-endopeptidase MepM/ murein hydrolase activator NlpD
MKINIKTFIFVSLIASMAACGQQKAQESTPVESDPVAPVVPVKTEYGIVTEDFITETGVVKSGQTLSGVFEHVGVPRNVAAQLNTLPASVFDVRKVRAGNQFTVFRMQDSLQTPAYIVYHSSLVDHVVFNTQDSLTVSNFQKTVTSVEKISNAVIETSLWDATVKNNLNLNLSLELSDIYAWVVDFFGIQKGDGFTVYYTENYVDSVSVGIGEIYACKFTHNKQDYYAYRYDNDSLGIHGYWDENGNSLRKAFLKAPLKFSRVSSRFTYARKHPVYKVVRPHTGVDYAAPMGTPVVAIGDGKVIFKGYKGGGGHTVKIKHNSIYTTAYLHLSKYGKGINVGAQVKQGQVIGYVGSTGASTGPHLDFRVWKGGSPIDPLKMESPSVEPVPAKAMDAFKAKKAEYDAKLTNR